MTQSQTVVDLQLVPMLDYLARVGRKAAENAPGVLRPRHIVAMKLLSEQGPVGQQTLAGGLSLDPSNVVGLLNELEAWSFVTRRRDPSDRRRHIVELSDKGIDELALASNRLGLIEDKLFASLSSEERQTLHTLLSRAVGATSVACAASDTPEDYLG